MAYSSNGCNKVEELPKVAGDYVQRKSGNMFDMMQERNVTTDHALYILAKTILFYTLSSRVRLSARLSVCHKPVLYQTTGIQCYAHKMAIAS